jgi:hypothetical protein
MLQHLRQQTLLRAAQRVLRVAAQLFLRAVCAGSFRPRSSVSMPTLRAQRQAHLQEGRQVHACRTLHGQRRKHKAATDSSASTAFQACTNSARRPAPVQLPTGRP